MDKLKVSYSYPMLKFYSLNADTNCLGHEGITFLKFSERWKFLGVRFSGIALRELIFFYLQ